ncbi:MAG: 2-amino-4-hydroxy-6-hydroxymethyldihydropteridine diphosphokinase [bacterium]|nr:2-amino-4-hydroxy-6-hydroxymethyldihydropteridine diphosphokinase [bacterium]
MSLRAALSLGSNLGQRRASLAAALRCLAAGGLDNLQVSSLWESAPVEVAGEQPAYLNCCATGDIDCDPEQLLAFCQRLETEAGRPAATHRAPRVLDIDLLFCGDELRSTERLTLPHPGLARRRFVLAPLAELEPDWRHPHEDATVLELLARLGPKQVVKRRETVTEWWRFEQQ